MGDFEYGGRGEGRGREGKGDLKAGTGEKKDANWKSQQDSEEDEEAEEKEKERQRVSHLDRNREIRDAEIQRWRDGDVIKPNHTRNKPDILHTEHKTQKRKRKETEPDTENKVIGKATERGDEMR